MISDYIRAFVLAYLAPRQSAAAILASGAGFGAAVLMVLAGYLLSSIFLALTPGLELPRQGGFIAQHMIALVWELVFFFAFAGVIQFFAKASGGAATREQTQVIVAWHSLVTSPLSVPYAMLALGVKTEEREGAPPVLEWPDGGTVALAAGAAVISLWLLANYITVAHRFRNFWGVAAVVYGVPVGLLFLAANLMAMASLSQQGIGQ